jgi:hypothetical protein
MEKPPARDEQELEDRLRAASDGIQLVVQQLNTLEDQKRGVDPTDTRFVELAKLVRVTVAELLQLATVEEEFARGLARAAAADLPSINEVQPRHDLRQILEEWRDVERRIAEVPPGSRESVELVDRFEQLRIEYARASEDKRQST